MTISIAALDISDNMVAIFVIGIAMLVPVLSILSKHQQRMTALMRENQGFPVQELLQEIRELKSLVGQQAFAIDTLAQSQKQLEARIAQGPSSRLDDQIQIRS